MPFIRYGVDFDVGKGETQPAPMRKENGKWRWKRHAEAIKPTYYRLMMARW